MPTFSAMHSLLKGLVPNLIASGLAAVIGAGVGGYITADVVSRDTTTRMRATSYSAYLAKIVPGLIISHDRELTDKEKEVIGHATGALMLTASEDVLCWAFAFEKEITSASPSAIDEFNTLWFKMRVEVLGEESGVEDTSEECSWSPF